ncbi:MAG: HNH endonuclease [Actinomycetota bacterium]
MFEDWITSLASVDDARCLRDLARLRAAVDAASARCAARVGDASRVRGATRCTQREADQVVARGELLAALPEVEAALSAGEISGAHVDALAKAADRTTVESVAGSRLLAIAKEKPADAMRRQVESHVRRESTADQAARRNARQRRARRGFLTHADMGVLPVEWDDSVFAEVRAVIDDEVNRAYHADGGRDGAAERRTPQQRFADVVADLLLGRERRAAGPPAVRTQMIVVVHPDGAGEIPGVGPLPPCEVERLACVSDLHGAVFSRDGQPLWLGDRVRLASDAQWRALIVRDGGCVGCGAHPARCEAHHVRWRRNGGPTDIDNLVLLCRHHHHLVHDAGWRVIRGPAGDWALVPP